MDARAAGKPSVHGARGAGRHAAARALALCWASSCCWRSPSPLFGMKTGVSGVNTLPDSFQSKQAFAAAQQPVLGGPRRAPRRSSSTGRRPRRRCRPPSRGCARRWPPTRLRPGAGADGQGRRPDPAHRADRRRVDQRSGPRQGARAARHLHSAGLQRQSGQGLRDRRHRLQRRLHRHRQLATSRGSSASSWRSASCCSCWPSARSWCPPRRSS